VHAALAEGLERGELLAHYQPIVDLRTGAVTAREALVRWAHPQRGLLEPASFLRGADRSALGVALGEQVLRLACATAAGWTDGCGVHVNVSARHLAEPGFVAFVKRCLADSGLPPSRLVLEITESLVLAASRSTLASTAALSNMGVGLCLDDFGTGYSSVTALHKLPIGAFKIDRSFVAGVPWNATSASLVDGLISLGTGMGLDVVAEGVETPEQQEWLAAHGCPHGQGFLFGRPVEI
jgi:EAL domain-containing protein (putative c-di-GMP-specific phosphodiesterase class I)